MECGLHVERTAAFSVQCLHVLFSVLETKRVYVDRTFLVALIFSLLYKIAAWHSRRARIGQTKQKQNKHKWVSLLNKEYVYIQFKHGAVSASSRRRVFVQRHGKCWSVVYRYGETSVGLH